MQRFYNRLNLEPITLLLKAAKVNKLGGGGVRLHGEVWIRSRRKRMLDLAICAIISPFALLILMVSVILIKFYDGWTPIYTQRRRGKDGIYFTIYKLRTYHPKTAEMSPLGRLLSILGSDETPQILYNIWRGDMAVIGARPIMDRDFELMRSTLGEDYYRSWYCAYITCRPGWMSAFSQPSRLYTPHSKAYLEARRDHEINYLSNACFSMDIAIFFRSLKMWCTDIPQLKAATAALLQSHR